MFKKITTNFTKYICNNDGKKLAELFSKDGCYHDYIYGSFTGKNEINDIGYLLDEYWNIKKQLSNLVSPKNIDEIYKVGKSSGALGGKLLGSGGSGFMMFYCEKKYQRKLIKSLN